MKKTLWFLGVLLTACSSQQELVNNIIIDKELVTSTNPIIVYKELGFGNGYNSASGHEYFSVLDYVNNASSTEIVSNAHGSSGFTELHIVDTKEKLRNALDISRSLEIQASYMGASASVSHKERIYKETVVNKFNQIAVAKAEYKNEPRVILNPNVKDELIKLAKKSPVEFMLTAGDMFVSKIYTGGSVYGMFELNQRDNTEKKINEKFIKAAASYLKNSVSVTNTSTQTTELSNQISKIKSLIITEGGKGATPNKQDLETFVTFISRFKSDINAADGAPVVLYVQLEPYENIAGFPKIDFSPIRVGQKGFLEKSQDIYDRIDRSIANASFVLDANNNRIFKPETVRDAKEKLAFYEASQSELNIITSIARNDFRKLDTASLKVLDTLKVYDPTIDYTNIPFHEVHTLTDSDTEQRLLITSRSPAEGSIYSGLYLMIEGNILSSEYSSSNAPESEKPVHYNWQIEYYYNHPFFHTSYAVYKGFTQPYYQVTFRDADDSTKIIYDQPFRGEPIPINQNVSVHVRLVNPMQVYYVKDRRGNYHVTKYDNARRKKEPKYKGQRVVKENEPIAKIYDPAGTKPLVKNKKTNIYLDKNKDYMFYDFDKVEKSN
ncbi:hypothetical protein [Daejeonella sp.]|uniref:hypothetical protein n=1 Tax=Daejeonella sp. TaxID=2805397 RepID=UPI0030C2C741